MRQEQKTPLPTDGCPVPNTRAANGRRLARAGQALVGLFLIGLAVALMFGLKSSQPMASLVGDPTTLSAPRTLTSVDDIAHESVKSNLTGSVVLLQDVVVQDVPGNYVFLVGRGRTIVPVLIVGEITHRQRERKINVKRGQHIRITGLLLPLETIESITATAYLSSAERKDLKAYSVYIAALRATRRQG